MKILIKVSLSKYFIMHMFFWFCLHNVHAQITYTPAKVPIEFTTGINFNNITNIENPVPASPFLGLSINAPFENNFHLNFGLEYTYTKIDEGKNKSPYFYDKNNYLKIKFVPQFKLKEFISLGIGLQGSILLSANRMYVDGSLPLGYSKESYTSYFNSTLDYFTSIELELLNRVGLGLNTSISLTDPDYTLSTFQFCVRYALNGKSNYESFNRTTKKTQKTNKKSHGPDIQSLKNDKSDSPYSFNISSGISLPLNDFASTASVIGPYGNAKPGYYISLSYNYQYKFVGWKMGAEFGINPVNSAYKQDIEEQFVNESQSIKFSNWKNSKFLTGPQLTFKGKRIGMQTSFLVGLLLMSHPDITIESDDLAYIHKIQHEGYSNIMQQIELSLFYCINKSTQLGLTAKHQYSDSKVKYLETTKSYQLGNVYHEDIYIGIPPRISNTIPDSGIYYTGWIGNQRIERKIIQKYSALNLGLTLSIKF